MRFQLHKSPELHKEAIVQLCERKFLFASSLVYFFACLFFFFFFFVLFRLCIEQVIWWLSGTTKNLQEFILFLKPSSYQYNDLDDNLEDEDNLDNEVYLWYEDCLDNLNNEVYLWYEDFLKDEDDLDNKVYLWYEDFLEDEDDLDNEVYLWYEDFLKDEDDLDNEVYLWYEDFLEDANILQDEDILKDKDNLEDWVCPCKDVHWYLCNGATVDATI